MASNHASRQDLQIVEAFSAVTVSERLLQESNIKQLITDMVNAQASVESSTSKLERARREQKGGNVIGNWWHDRGDAVQDGQLELSKSIGDLTQRSSQLLIVNTAISKVLSDQQSILLRQQQLLKSQADALQAQNDKIYEQQKVLEQQQKEINAANQGLMEAKGISQEQAQKLVGCVIRVTDAEAKMEAANMALGLSLERRLEDASAKYLERSEAGLIRFLEDAAELGAATEKALDMRAQSLDRQLAELASSVQRLSTDLKASSESAQGTELKVTELHQALNEARSRQFFAATAAMVLALAALGWQAASQFL